MQPISVSERLPDLWPGTPTTSSKVLAFAGDWYIAHVHIIDGEVRWIEYDDEARELTGVTHWLPLPQAPIVPQNGAESVTGDV